MKNGTVLLWKYDANSHSTWFRRFVSQCIIYFTKSDYTHAAIYNKGLVYESSIWKEKGLSRNGARVGSISGADVFLEPKVPLTGKQVNKIEEYCQIMVGLKIRYNFLKLLSLTWIYPTRWFWNKIGFVPFDLPFIYGEVCSGFVDDAYNYAGIDLLENEHEGYTVPGNFIKCDKLKIME